MPKALQACLAAAALAASTVAAGCGGEASRPTATASVNELVIIGGETREDGEKGGYALRGAAIASDPAPTIRVKAGEQVRIKFDNVHGMFHGESIPHDFVIVADKDLPDSLSPGNVLWGAQTKVISPEEAADVITFTPDKPRTYYYICSVPGHVGRGMWGRFIVEE